MIVLFVPYATWVVFSSMDETFDVQLSPWFAISNSALKGNSQKKNSNFYWNLIKLYSTQNGRGHVCVPYATWLPVSLWRKVLSWDICPPQLKHQMKKFWLKTSVLYDELLSIVPTQHFVPYTTVCYVRCVLNNPSVTLVKNWLFSSNLISSSWL